MSRKNTFNSPCQEFLVNEFTRRQGRNSSYSIRAFARDLGISKTTINDVMRGERRLSTYHIESISTCLSLDEATIKFLKKDDINTSERNRLVLLEDEFRVIKDWYYLAILNLAKLPNNQCCADWIAERLGLSQELAERSLAELLGLGLIENRDGKIFRTSKTITTSTNIPSESIREHHKQSLVKAVDALEEVPIELRDYTTVTYVLNPEKIQDAKNLIFSFHRKLGKLLDCKQATEVYRLNIQFFPLTKTQEQAQA